MDKRMPKLLRFAGRVLRDFFLRNHGLLLTAAVAHNIMLSLIPLSAVFVVVFSHYYEEAFLLDTLTAEVALIAPGFVPVLTEVLAGFLAGRELIGWVGGLSLLLFSSLAFRVLEDSIAIIFHRPVTPLKRKFWVSALMPYLFIGIVVCGLVALTIVNGVLDADGIDFLNIDRFTNHLVYLANMAGLVLLFALFYKIMPVVKISFRRALAGGLTATILWEVARRLVVAYFTNVSVVNALYGSMATIVIVLLTLEAIALILLLGAQVIADLQRSSDAGIAWHEDPDDTIDPSI